MTTPSTQSHGQPPRDWLSWSLAATILCFLPVGLVALFYGVRSNRALADGRLQDAQRASSVARRWLIATIATGALIYLVLSLLFLGLGAFSS